MAWPEVFHIDVFAMRFWASGIGQRRVAYEIKCSREDFWSELRRPQKRARAMEISHQFFFVAPKHLIQPSEIPEGCGLIEYANQKTRLKLDAPIRQPRWFDEQEVLYLLRRDMFRSKAPELQRRLHFEQYRSQRLTEALARKDERIRELEDALAT